jgi:hypothetical protein
MAHGGATGGDPAQRGLPEVLLALTFGTGLLDSVSYLKLGHVFVAPPRGLTSAAAFPQAYRARTGEEPPAAAMKSAKGANLLREA